MEEGRRCEKGRTRASGLPVEGKALFCLEGKGRVCGRGWWVGFRVDGRGEERREQVRRAGGQTLNCSGKRRGEPVRRAVKK